MKFPLVRWFSHIPLRHLTRFKFWPCCDSVSLDVLREDELITNTKECPMRKEITISSCCGRSRNPTFSRLQSYA
jgi:hypothetical protein